MKSLLIDRWSVYQTLVGAQDILTHIHEYHNDNPFLNTAREALEEAGASLRHSISLYKRKKKGNELKEVDNAFNTCFYQFRDYLESTAKMEVLGEQALASKRIAQQIKKINRTLHREPYVIQLSTFGLLQQFCDTDLKEDIEISGTANIYKSLVHHFEKMVKLREEQIAIILENKKITSPSAASLKVKKIIPMIYNHISDYAELSPEEYGQSKRNLDILLKPILSNVKSRITRGRNRKLKEEELVDARTTPRIILTSHNKLLPEDIVPKKIVLVETDQRRNSHVDQHGKEEH